MKQEIINTIPFEIVEKYASYNSDFVEFLCMEFGGDVAKRIVDDYALGNIDGKTILWNIGTHGEVYGGQVIGYNRQGYIRNDWRDNLIKSASDVDGMLLGWYCKEKGLHDDVEPVDNLSIGDVDERFVATPSIFGLHLMRLFHSKPIVLTEYHKAALIGSCLQPKFNWMATGCNVRDMDLNTLRPLQGKSVIVFPTNHNYYDWCKIAKKIDWCHISVSSIMQDFQTEWMQDIGDILLSDYGRNGGDISEDNAHDDKVIEVQVTPQQKALQTMIQANPVISTLIDKFALELVI